MSEAVTAGEAKFMLELCDEHGWDKLKELAEQLIRREEGE